jgi:hypothetical protein
MSQQSMSKGFYRRKGPQVTPREETVDADRVPTVTTMAEGGGKATDMKVAGQNTAQPGTGKLSGRNFLGHRVT